MSVKLKVTYEDGSEEDFEFEKNAYSITLESIADRKQDPPAVTVDLSGLEECTSLQLLDLRRNRIKKIDLSPLTKCENLSSLTLSHNSLSSIDLSPLGSCKKLERIDLQENQLERISLVPLSRCTNLAALDLSANGLKGIDLSPLASCHAFESLDLARNPLRSLDATPLLLNPNFEVLRYGKGPLGIEDYRRRETAPKVTTWIRRPFHGKEERAWLRQAKVNPPTEIDTWEFLHRTMRIPHAMSIPIQSYILNTLGFEGYGLIDDDISDFLLSIPPIAQIDEVRNRVRPFLVDKICNQIDNGRTTIGLDAQNLAQGTVEIARRLKRIAEVRESEMKNAVIWDESKEVATYNIFELALTAYGFLILKNVDANRISVSFRNRLLFQVDGETLSQIQHAIHEIGFDVPIHEVEGHDPFAQVLFEPRNMSRQMMYHVLGLVRTNPH